MPNIKWIRIDNRLVHGQVATSWIQHTQANLVLVANDNVAGSEMRQGLMESIIPAHVQSRFFTLQKTAEVIHKASDSQHILLVIENPIDALWLVKNGVPIPHINIGNMHGGEGKVMLAKAAYASSEELTALKELVSLGVTIEFQQLPTDSVIKLNEVIQKH
ncbi:MAG: PTS system mannose/fructose/N-acetylgalactosamine-transporter subunit IIB [Brevinema sp.]